ncbi:MAG: type II toxin-antitoxin system prevent-host-death family antitoxin [Methylocystis sp.]|uniref:type II toxin-antitoxin system prevent-host-death family antitoxin n=1 Tax=Methylocystis sp. TaxID=1911079 RepID=UPI00392F9642
MKVSTAEFIKNYGALADKALSEPVTITKNGRDRLVVISAEEYSRLKRRDRRVVKLEDFTEEEIALIARVEVPPGHEHLDEELKDWRP